MARERTIILTNLDSTGLGGKKEKRERKREKGGEFRERDSTFSLDLLVIGPLNPGETKGKVDPHCKSYACLWSFDKLREVGVFSYLVISCLKSHENCFGCCEAGKGHGLRSHESGTVA